MGDVHLLGSLIVHGIALDETKNFKKSTFDLRSRRRKNDTTEYPAATKTITKRQNSAAQFEFEVFIT